MSKILLISALFLTLTACSDKSQIEKPQEPITDITYRATTVLGSGDFGVFPEAKGSKILTIRIKNDGPEVLTGPATLSNSDFSIIFQSGCNSVAVAKTCTLKVAFNADNKLAQSYSANLILGEAQVPLIAEVEGEETPITAVEFLLNGVAVVNNEIDFGSFTGTQGSLKTIAVKNNGTVPFSSPVVVSSNFTKLYDNCSSLAPGRSCSVRVSFSAVGKSGEVLGTLEVAGSSLNLKAEVSTPATTGTQSPNVVWLINSQQLTSPATFDVGDYLGTQSTQLIVYARNIGTVAAPATPVSLNNSNFMVVFNQCNNRILAPNGTCQVRISFAAQGKSPGDYSSILTFGDRTLTLSGTVLDPAGEITYEAVFSDYSPCSATQACEGQGVESRTLNSCNKLVGGVVTESLPAASCPQFETPELLSRACGSPEGSVIQDILDEGNLAGSLTITCSSGQPLAEGSRSVNCNPEHEQDGENCIKMYSLTVSKPAGVGTVTTSKSICDANCTLSTDLYRRDQMAELVFSPVSEQYNLSQFGGDNQYCSGLACSNIDMSSSRNIDVQVYERPVLVLNETADYTLNLQGTGNYLISGYSITPNFSNTKAYYVEPNASYNIDVVVSSGSNVNTGWYVDEVLQSPPVNNSRQVDVSSSSRSVHVTIGLQNALCGNTVGDYFGVKPNAGTTAWNATTGQYSSRCIPTVKNQTSCIEGFYDLTTPGGPQYKYVYRSASMFPISNDPLDPDPSYPYTQGACVKSEVDCTSSIDNAKFAYLTSFQGENAQYGSCEVSECNDGYQNSFVSCDVRKLYFSGLSSGSTYQIHSYDFSTNNLTQISSANVESGFTRAPILYEVSTAKNVYYTTVNGSTGEPNIFKTTDAGVTTPIVNLGNFSSTPSSLVVSEDNNRLFFIGSDFTAGREMAHASTTNTSSVVPSPSVVNYVAGSTAGVGSNAQLYTTSGGWVWLIGLNNTVHGLEAGRINPSSPSAITPADTVAGATNGFDNTQMNSRTTAVYDFMFFTVATSTANGVEIYRFNNINPAAPARVLFADVVSGSGSSNPRLLTVWGNRLFFSATNGTELELYYKDLTTGTIPNTTATKINLVPGATGATSINDMIVFKNELYISANLGDGNGVELHKVSFDGTNYSVSLVADINPGSGNSSPQRLAENGESLYFLGDQGTGLSLLRYNPEIGVVNLSVTKSVTPANPSFQGNLGKSLIVR